MQVERNDWHARVYMWWYLNKYYSSSGRWRRCRESPAQKKVSNLCPYMRVVMFWAPLRALFWNWLVLFRIKNFEVTLNMLIIPFLMFSLPPLAGYVSYILKLILWAFTIVTWAGGALALIAIGGYLLMDRHFLPYLVRKFPPTGESDEEVLARHRRESEKERKKYEKRKKRQESTERFFDMLFEFFRSAHDRVCPEVEFVEEIKPSPPSGTYETKEYDV